MNFALKKRWNTQGNLVPFGTRTASSFQERRRGVPSSFMRVVVVLIIMDFEHVEKSPLWSRISPWFNPSLIPPHFLLPPAHMLIPIANFTFILPCCITAWPTVVNENCTQLMCCEKLMWCTLCVWPTQFLYYYYNSYKHGNNCYYLNSLYAPLFRNQLLKLLLATYGEMQIRHGNLEQEQQEWISVPLWYPFLWIPKNPAKGSTSSSSWHNPEHNCQFPINKEGPGNYFLVNSSALYFLLRNSNQFQACIYENVVGDDMRTVPKDKGFSTEGVWLECPKG